VRETEIIDYLQLPKQPTKIAIENIKASAERPKQRMREVISVVVAAIAEH